MLGIEHIFRIIISFSATRQVSFAKCNHRRSLRIPTIVQCMAQKSPSAPRVALALTIGHPNVLSLLHDPPDGQGLEIHKSQKTYLDDGDF